MLLCYGLMPEINVYSYGIYIHEFCHTYNMSQNGETCHQILHHLLVDLSSFFFTSASWRNFHQVTLAGSINNRWKVYSQLNLFNISLTLAWRFTDASCPAIFYFSLFSGCCWSAVVRQRQTNAEYVLTISSVLYGCAVKPLRRRIGFLSNWLAKPSHNQATNAIYCTVSYFVF